MLRDQVRLEAARHIAEALSVGAPPQQAAAPQGHPQPQPMPQPGQQPPMGALAASMPGGPGGMPQQRPAMSPLQAVPSFRSPPMQAALQGAEGIKGHPALNKPVGFAEGGFVVRR